VDDRNREVTQSGSEARSALARAVAVGDASGVSALYTEDAWLLAPAATPIRGSNAIERYWQTGVDAGVRELALKPVAIATHHDVAYELGRYALAIESEGQKFAGHGDYVLVHERQDDGSWLWAVEMFNPDADPRTASANETPRREK
jgi:ketosteroid isomerase-like protein